MAKKTQVSNNPVLTAPRRKWTDLERCTLWAKYAGRCGMCNSILYENDFTSDKVSIANLAHVIAHSDNGPRANHQISQEYKDSIDNVILLCPKCHKTIDSLPEIYTTEYLFDLKKRFETKIRVQTQPTEEHRRQIFIFTAPINGSVRSITEDDAIKAMRPKQHQFEKPIRLDIPENLFTEENADFWNSAIKRIDREFDKYIDDTLCDFPQIAVFGLAPQPLLAYLGWKIGDKVDYQIFQRHRNQTPAWQWQSTEDAPMFNVIAPSEDSCNRDKEKSGRLVLSLSVSFDISERVQGYLDPNDLHWQLKSSEACSVDYIKTEQQVFQFRREIHKLLNEITQQAGTRPIHLYMSVPNSLAVCFGMSILPKATAPIIIYEYLLTQNKDIESITINPSNK